MRGVVVGGGAGGASDPMGSQSVPVYFDSEGEVKRCYNNTFSGESGRLAVNISGTSSTVDWTSKSTTSTAETIYVGGKLSTSPDACFNTDITINTSTNVMQGAAWNDYAEYRNCEGAPGQVVCENGCGKLIPSVKRLQKCSYIISDTFGFTVGEVTEFTKPIAVAGRVLAYTDCNNLKVGDVVCSGKDGTVSKMSRIEIILFPDRIVGYVSEIPEYSTWNNINVNNRIWIKVR